MSEPTPEMIAALLREQAPRLEEAKARVGSAPPPVEQAAPPPPVEGEAPSGNLLKMIVKMLLDKMGSRESTAALTGDTTADDVRALDAQVNPPAVR